MVFYPPSSIKLPFDPPDSVTVPEFVFREDGVRKPHSRSRNPFTCGISGKTYTTVKVIERQKLLARALAKRLGYDIREGTEWDRVVALYSVNTIDYITMTHAVHRLNGIVTPASAAYSAPELEHQLRSSGANALFTCVPLLEVALQAAKAAGIPEDRIFLLPVPGAESKQPFKTIDDLVAEGTDAPELKPLDWIKGQGERQVAYLCYSSGTSGLPKAVQITHRNVIANVLQATIQNEEGRKAAGVDAQIQLGLLPLSHIYGLVPVAHYGIYNGDETIILPKFDLKLLLSAIQRFKIQQMALVPPIFIQMMSSYAECQKYDLSTVRFIFSGAAPLGKETTLDLNKHWPSWRICQGYGLTETSPVVTSTSELDIDPGSSGTLLPGLKAKLIDVEGKEVTEYNKPGELYVQGPTVVLGYLNNAKATSETFVHHDDGRWMRTGDEVIVRKSPKGTEHFVVVDRIKELIKVKVKTLLLHVLNPIIDTSKQGHQVAPAELEAHLLTHPLVDDCAVIQVPDLRAGEVPKAFVVKAPQAKGKSDDEVTQSINKHVEEHKARHKWLKGGIEFIDVIPKSPSGKILRRLLRDREKQARKEKGAKL
ncbi:putative phenylacetyl- ligase [Fusarium sporotrichioides]|uniref:Putative phenylacetyl-ligase n=1 Tax=Fusarium sporotrichioides TaxID=5514 RepID=A0A395RTZ0_FUSSP|nr:putative phenylacetyl- ligase [Fusarium sporotrichioides]